MLVTGFLAGRELWVAEYVKTNKGLLADVPVFPGAERLGSPATRHYDGDLFDLGSSGYQTEAVFRLTRRASRAEIVKFYDTSMDASWMRPTTRCRGFVRRGRLVLVAVDPFDPATLSVLVDSHGADTCSSASSVLDS